MLCLILPSSGNWFKDCLSWEFYLDHCGLIRWRLFCDVTDLPYTRIWLRFFCYTKLMSVTQKALNWITFMFWKTVSWLILLLLRFRIIIKISVLKKEIRSEQKKSTYLFGLGNISLPLGLHPSCVSTEKYQKNSLFHPGLYRDQYNYPVINSQRRLRSTYSYAMLSVSIPLGN